VNFKFIALIFILMSCSSRDNHVKKEIRNISFKENKHINHNDFNDYLVQDHKKIGQLFFDESSEFFVNEKTSSQNNDELVNLSLLCRRKQNTEATNLIKKLNSKYKKIPAFWNIVSSCYLEFGDFRKSLLFLNQSLELSPDYAPALNNLGVYYLRQGLDQKALIAFEKSLNASKFSKIPKFNLTKLLLKYGLLDLSRPLLNSLLSENANEVKLIELLAYQALFEGDYQKSIEMLTGLNNKNISSSELLLAISFNYHKLKDVNKSKAYLSKINPKKLSENQKYFFNYLSSAKGVQ